MGIDSIRGPAPVDPHASSAEPADSARGEGFEAFRANAARPAGAPSAESAQLDPTASAFAMPAVEPVPTSPLDLVRSGRIDVARYLDLKVEEATAHLRALPPAQLASIRSTLRDRLATDPALADLVKIAAGRPLPADDE
jgi:hypothetical protein